MFEFTTGNKVWVNTGDGVLIGRFSSLGAEVYSKGGDPLWQGEGVSHGDWEAFRARVEEHHGFEVNPLRHEFGARHRFRAFEFIGAGRHRAVFRFDERRVFKVAFGPDGFCANSSEAFQYDRFGKARGYIPYAECWEGEVDGWPVLFMEYVDTRNVPFGNLPDWAHSVDCSQVGFDAEGRLVAYDFG